MTPGQAGPDTWLGDWADRWNEELKQLRFTPPVAWIYNPWQYAREGRDAYFSKLNARPEVLFLGMNPGPWGMAQNGVPFGERDMVRDWLGIDVQVGRPDPEHPKRPVRGMACTRSEVSGSRLWGLMRKRFGRPEAFFATQAILPYCPLMWMKERGANLPPNVLRVSERRPLEHLCDRYLDEVLEFLAPVHLVAIGVYAEEALRRVRPDCRVVRILHPSPASPAANRDWAGSVSRTLAEAGVWS